MQPKRTACCDLHVHSCHSDGTHTPEELIELAQKAGLSAVALCDHNTVSGLPAFLTAAEGSGVEAVPGIEFSTDYMGQDAHILMLFVQPQHYATITERLALLLQAKAQSNFKLVQALNQAGMVLDYDRLCGQTPDGYINRAHIAAELTRLGYTASIKEAFSTLLVPGGRFYTPPQYPDVLETIGFIKALGGKAVLAHPYLSLREHQLETLLPKAVAAGLDAMETYYARYDEATTGKAKTTAARFGLLESGGSDFHGTNKPDTKIGVGRGDLHIPMCVLEKLREK